MDDWYNDGLPHLWLPYTQMKTAAKPLPVVATEGCKIKLADGRELVDGIASWWSACHGYNHPHIRAAVEKQLQHMPHVMLGGLVHEQAATLAKRLTDMAPSGLTKVFFGDSGSVAVEIALKMALQYWKNLGKPMKDRFLCFKHGYHGDTLGAMSVSDPEASMHKAFRNSVIKQYVVDIPRDEYAFAEFDALLSGIHKSVAGVIIEPLVQGAGGMKFHSADLLAEIHRIVKKYDLLFIADEIATGFYRTGNLFACNEAGIAPDILCLGKALTGGTMTLGATLAQQHVFDAFLSDDTEHAFMHGPTFMGNALACAAANASLDLFQLSVDSYQLSAKKNSSVNCQLTTDNWPARIEHIERQLTAGLAPCRALPGVVDVRVKGAIGVVQLQKLDKQKLRAEFVKRGVWIRPIEDVIYLTPAFIISEDELEILMESVIEIVKISQSI